MQLLILQFVSPHLENPPGVFSHDLGVLAALLENEGIACSLATLPGYSPDRLRSAIIEHRPRCILVELMPRSITAARRTITEVRSSYGLPVISLGPYATCHPALAVSIPGTEALLVGEYDRSGVELLTALRDGMDPAGIAGVWASGRDGIVKGPLAPLTEDLDSLPHPLRDLFDTERIVRTTGELSFKVARGCPMWCAYCFNDWYMDLYAGAGEFVRRRSVADVLDEVADVVRRFDAARSVAFLDHCFAMDADWLGALATEYPRRCDLPYRCHVRLERVTPQIAGLLAGSNCEWVHTHVGSGSKFIRDEVFSMKLTNRQILTALRTLHEAGLKVAAEVFVGSPYESQITVEETIGLLHSGEVDEVHPRVYYPTPGTRAAELCRENGWISGRGEEDYWRGRSVLNMPSMPAGRIEAIIGRFPSLLKKPSRGALGKLMSGIRRIRRPRVRRRRN